MKGGSTGSPPPLKTTEYRQRSCIRDKMSDILSNEVKKELQRGLDIISRMNFSQLNSDPTPSKSVDNGTTNNENVDTIHTTTTTSAKESNNIEWLQIIELNFSSNEKNSNNEEVFSCHVCGAANIKDKKDTTSKNLSQCSKCHKVSYCSKSCQILDWKSNKNSHKKFCTMYNQLRSTTADESTIAKNKIKEMLLSSIQIYSNSYAAYNCFIHGIGRGFLFVQCTLSLQQLLFLPKYEGKSINSSLLIHYLTLGEYDQELCREDFELALLRKELVSVLENYDHYKEVIYVLKFKCGHLALGCVNMKPDVEICKKLAKDYFSNLGNQDALQLNLDSLEN